MTSGIITLRALDYDSRRSKAIAGNHHRRIGKVHEQDVGRHARGNAALRQDRVGAVNVPGRLGAGYPARRCGTPFGVGPGVDGHGLEPCQPATGLRRADFNPHATEHNHASRAAARSRGDCWARPNERPYALHRNGYAGMQRYASFLWSGDVHSTWETLKVQVPIAVNTSLTGIPYWGTDIGGFIPTREFTAELYLRWFQFGAFCTLFRSHGRAWKAAPALGLEHGRSRSGRDRQQQWSRHS